MATLNDWHTSAKEKGLDFEQYIQINQLQDLKRLKESGLPSYEVLLINGPEFDSSKTKEFISRFDMIWCRAVNNITKKRYYELGMKNFDEFSKFLETLPSKLEDMSLQIFEFHENIFGGNIISSEDKTIIEIAYGIQDNVSKSLTSFFHGHITNTGRLEFCEKEVPIEMKKAALKALNYLKKTRNHYIQGYFEFSVSKEGNIFFLDYKTGFPKLI